MCSLHFSCENPHEKKYVKIKVDLGKYNAS